MRSNIQINKFNELDNSSFAVFAPKLVEYLQSQYHLEISIEPLPNAASAIFDGTSIRLSDIQSGEKQVFILLHLTGHAAQLATRPEWREAGAEVFDLRISLDNEQKIRDYELEASGYGVDILHELGRGDLVSWFEQLAAVDLEYFINFCKTGEFGSIDRFQGVASYKIERRRLPEFEPVKIGEIIIV
jgi:hypothetical protein